LGRIPDATIQEIRDRADIVGLIGRHVELKQAGRNWKGLCPFHDEKSPSFNVSADRGIFHCFGCQAGGDAIEFLIRYENLTFPEAVRTLAQDLGIVIPESDSGSQRGETEGIHASLATAQDHYQATLAGPAGAAGRDYLEARGIDAATIEGFGLGFAEDAWDGVLRALDAKGITAAAGETAGLLLERKNGGHYDRLRGRVTFPIYDVRGRVIAFGGRALSKEQEPKYLNTPESAVYHKRQAFYGFPQALEPIRRRERAVICEGYFDAIALARADVGEAIATCGTALTADHAKNLRRRTQNVHLLFDGDAAGQKAMERGLSVLLPEGLRVRAIALPGGQDPDDYLNAHGADALRELVDKAPDALEVAMRRAMAGGCSTPTEKTDVVQHIASLLAAVPNPVERSEYTRRLAVSTSTDLGAVEAVVRAAVRGEGRSAESEREVAVVRPRHNGPEDRHLRQLALIVSRHPGLATEMACKRMHDVLPEGSWKDLAFKLIEAAEAGCVDAEGAIDANRAGERLDAADRALLHDITVDDALLDSEIPAEEVFEHLLSRYQVKDLEAKEKELTRRMQDPEADLQTLLREKQSLLERKRARAGIALNSAT
jgi:DNA primase